MKKISIVSYTYNEEGNIQKFYDEVKAILHSLPQYDFEIIVADNCSTDQTEKILRKIASDDPNFKVILNARNFGHLRSPFNAVLAGTGDAVIALPSDLQIPTSIIPKLIKQWEKGADVVCAIAEESEEATHMWMLRTFFYKFMNLVSELPHIEHFTGSGLYSSRFMEALRKFEEPYPYIRGLVSEIGFNQAKVFYKKAEREKGKTKNNYYTLYDCAVTGLLNHSKLPMRLTSLFGWAVAFFSLLISIGYLIAKLLMWNSFELGQAPLLIGLFFIAAVQLISIGMLGEYAIAINAQTKKRPMVVEKERINF